jgi:glycosyl transferase family 1
MAGHGDIRGRENPGGLVRVGGSRSIVFMHVALLTNRAWLDEELVSFQHMVVGLIGEQVRVAQVVPEDVSSEDLSAFGECVPWLETSVVLLNRYRVGQLNGVLEGLGVDLIHALDGRMWHGGLKLAEAMDVPIVLSANSMLDIPLSRKVLGRVDVSRVAVSGATEPITGAIREAAGSELLIRCIQTGVHQHDGGPPSLGEDETMCAIVSGNGVWDADYDALLEGIAEFVKRWPMSQFFFDGQGAGQHQLWKNASEMGLMGNLSLTPRRLGHREMLLRAHALIHPQALGRSRSLTLGAMARGLPVIAREDGYLDYLIDGETAVVLSEPGAEDWSAQLERLMTERRWIAELGRRAMSWMNQHRTTSNQINGVLDMYRRMAGQTIPFPG